MKAVLFDLDGTLIDTAADFIRIIQQMCRDEQRPVVDAETIRTQVSEGARAMVKLVYPELEVTDPIFLAHRQRFLDLYGDNIVVDTDLFLGMYPLLEALEAKQIPWGIVTNKPRGLSESLLAELNLPNSYILVYGALPPKTHSPQHPLPRSNVFTWRFYLGGGKGHSGVTQFSRVYRRYTCY